MGGDMRERSHGVSDPKEELDADGGIAEDLELDDADADAVTGGATPINPAGPIPIPYPNTNR
jgi:hypothetical protein